MILAELTEDRWESTLGWILYVSSQLSRFGNGWDAMRVRELEKNR